MRKPKVGDIVEVTWLDSGCGEIGRRQTHQAKLQFGTTYGQVTYVGPDLKICEKMCTKSKHRCTYLEIAMCSSGPEDEKSDLAGIWWDAVVSVRRLR